MSLLTSNTSLALSLSFLRDKTPGTAVPLRPLETFSPFEPLDSVNLAIFLRMRSPGDLLGDLVVGGGRGVSWREVSGVSVVRGGVCEERKR